MAEALFRVIHAGPYLTVQDSGRLGWQRFGVTESGPMDRAAAVMANIAAGNPADAPLIEVSIGGLILECEVGPVTIAIAGGGFIVTLDGARFGSWQVLTVQAGQRLVIRPGPWGSWTCLAFAGELDCPLWLGSAATHGLSGLGGGRLARGDLLRIRNPRVRPTPPRAIPCPVWARPRTTVRATLGPQDRHFTPQAIAALRGGTFRLTSAYDRMGVRLSGPPLDLAGALSIPSEAVLRGSVQVAGDGVATVLLADHQTTGGYPKIATVISADLDGFAQCRSGQAVRFRLVTPDQAVALTRVRMRAVQATLVRLRQQMQPDTAYGRDDDHRP
ncbi:MAG: biotin-dependent carboxyltransferase family protein [Paracoccus sp. (in: a-proteobacteria)]|uniref:5-oxoprolinase subunit C family protein n=1 Tax=Paracoccus sp. TaxID=267 RepID=UPI0026E0D79A|nr:biotin-dependent carboxyltransferase family protein [Paracoccus sp. (in: a-proteobacteria)]MDO5630377.1 biotin-dependent carboxyltransferase family protein [Paracoccus sp. (in: a-proteobacteria)]